jgi:glyoxylase-like metal-dependent hydrolase (beta-lactamase superfamily II)
MQTITRRRVLIGCGAACAAGCATPLPAPAAAQPLELAPGVFMVAGTGGAADLRNLGRIGNAGFIVGEAGVIAIDTGTSYAHGQALLAAIGLVTRLPVRMVLITHTRSEFVFGGAAFRERGIPIRMHGRASRLMASRCETCLKTLRLTVGEEPMRGTVVYKPDQEFDSTHSLDLIGRPVQVLHFGHSSGPGDVAVLDHRSAVLYAGGLLDAGRIPDIQDSDLAGWKTALHELQALRIATIVPGHGAASSSQLISANERYLVQLEARIRTLVASGTSLLNVADACDLPEFETWDQYDTIHRRNASVAYLRVERELLFR